ncbi:MAG TPA: ABC transporter permease [Sediminispirochaeta sp.]|nr:ABC transporter permease [Sediminispirochaeta sp.]
MKLRKIAWRNIRRNGRRSLLSMSAIGIAAMAFVFLFGFIEGMKHDVAYNIHTFVNGEVLVRHQDFAKYRHLNPLHLGVKNYQELVSNLETRPEVEMMSPRIKFPTAIYQEGNTYRAQGMGVDFNHETEYQQIEQYVVEGRLPRNGENEALIASGLAKDMGLEIGDRFTILTQTMGRGMNAITLNITGISHYDFQGLNGNFFQAPLDRIQYLLRMEDSVSEILIKLHEDYTPESFASVLKTELLQGESWAELEAAPWTRISETYNMIALAEAIYYLIALLFFFLGSTVIINTMMMTVFERRKEIGTVSAMGMTGPEVVRLFFLEAFYISVIGSFVGVLVGIGITYPLSIYGISFGAAMEGVDFEMSEVVRPILNFKSTIFVFVYSSLVASLASLIPSRKSAKVKPVEALRAI